MLSPEFRTNIPEILRTHSERSPFVMAEIGQGRPIVAITAATHGNEDIGVDIISHLKDSLDLQQGTARFIVANPPALARGVRFIKQDLNRAYPGTHGASDEAGIAPQVLGLVEDADYVIDLHSTSSQTESFAIVTKKDEEQLRLAEMTGVKNIVFIPRKEEGYAMVDYVRCGIGIELGLHKSTYAYESGIKAVKNVLSRLGMLPKHSEVEDGEREYFELFGSVKSSPHSLVLVTPYAQNFTLVRKGEVVAQLSTPGERQQLSTPFGVLGPMYIEAEEDFYPVLAGEQAYAETVCLKAQKVTREEIVNS